MKALSRLKALLVAATSLSCVWLQAADAATGHAHNRFGHVGKTLPAKGPVPKIILISLDGATPRLIDKYIDSGVKGVGLLRAIGSHAPDAHVYINLQGRESGGNVDVTTYNAIVQAISKYFKGATDSNSTFNYSLNKRHIFTQVYVQPSDCGNAGFCTSDKVGQHSGDVFGVMAEGYNFDGTQSPGVARLGDPAYDPNSTSLSVPNFYVAHGHDSNGPNMSASFYAAGPNIRHNVVVKKMHNIDVAPTIDAILGVAPAATVDGSALLPILK